MAFYVNLVMASNVMDMKKYQYIFFFLSYQKQKQNSPSFLCWKGEKINWDIFFFSAEKNQVLRSHIPAGRLNNVCAKLCCIHLHRVWVDTRGCENNTHACQNGAWAR